MSISNPEADQRAETDAILQEVAHSFGTPAFVYFTSSIARRAEELRAAFKGRFLLSFAVKSNPNPSLLRWLKDHVELLDISSIGEFRIALKAGWEPSRLSFTGPGKRDFELSEALEGDLGELIVESVREAVAADRIARAMGKVQDIMIRIAPSSVPKGFGDQMAGRPSPFGLDVEQLDAELPQILALPNLRLVGFHIYSGTQCLKAEAICENYRTFIGIFREAAAKFDLRPAKLVFGSGLGIPYHAGDTALYGDMKLTAELYEPQLGFLPIGDLFTMGPREAAYACRFLGLNQVVPIHYDTFDVIRQDPHSWAERVSAETRLSLWS